MKSYSDSDRNSRNSRSRDQLIWSMIFVIAAGIVSIALAKFSGSLQLRHHNDSSTYTDFQWNTSSRGLGGFRTPLYPAFVQSVIGLAGESSVPVAQAIVTIIAVLIFFSGLIRCGYRTPIATAMACTLVLGRPLWDYAGDLLADSLAMSSALIACGFFLHSIAPYINNQSLRGVSTERDHPSTLVWISLAVATFVTYLIRPAYLYLVVLWPLLAIWFTSFVFVQRHRTSLNRFGILLRYLAVVTIPYLLYSGFRLAIVGHFGIVSFGGYNTIGIASLAIDQSLIAELPSADQPLAKAILDELMENNVPHHIAGGFVHIERNYADAIWKASVPAAEVAYGNDTNRVNRALNQLSSNIFRLRPAYYRRWIVENVVHGLRDIAQLTWTDHGTVVAIAVSLLYLFFRCLANQFSSIFKLQFFKVRSPDQSSEPMLRKFRYLESQLLLWLAIGFACGKLFLVALIEPTIGRYMTAAAMLFPAVLVSIAWHWLEAIPWPAHRSEEPNQTTV